ncbi:MAG: amidase family protein, partial [Pseudomonadota bacterium]
TLNPRNPELTPGGSSGGAGAAVAAGLCAIGHGTDIAGSIRYPAYACGVHGLRPSFGRVPTFNATGGDRFIGGQVMAVSGPLARSIEDIDLALHAMSGTSPHDPWSVPAPLAGDPVVPRAALCLAPEGLAVATQVQDALLGAARALQDAGWQIDEVPCPPLREAADINTILWMAETVFAAGTAMADEGDAEAQFVYDQMCRDVGPIDLERVMHALKRRSALIRAWEQFFAQYPLMICPMSGELPFEQHLDIRSEAAFQRVYEAQLTQRALPVMGMPALSVATGMAGTHPNGVQLVAGRFREDIVLRAGKVVEAAFGAPSIAEPGQR